MKTILIFLIVIHIFAGCSKKVVPNSDYFNSGSRIGLILIINEIENHDEIYWRSQVDEFLLTYVRHRYSQSQFNSYTIPVDKYNNVLKNIEKQQSPQSRIERLYLDAFESEGKRIAIVNEKFDSINVKSGKIIASKNLQCLKEKYQIDEALIVVFRYGLISKYNPAVSKNQTAEEINNYGIAEIYSQGIDLKSSSVLFNSKSSAKATVKGKRKANLHYNEVEDLIKKSVEEVLANEKRKYF